MIIITDPIFEIGPVPHLPHCNIIEREYREGQWHYGIINSYNAYGSGWADEDFIISEVTKEQQLKSPGKTTRAKKSNAACSQKECIYAHRITLIAYLNRSLLVT